jgi:hypothetical protein
VTVEQVVTVVTVVTVDIVPDIVTVPVGVTLISLTVHLTSAKKPNLETYS